MGPRKHSALANTSSLLWHAYKALPAPSCHVNWAGFYVLDRAANGVSSATTGNPAANTANSAKTVGPAANTVNSANNGSNNGTNTAQTTQRLILGPFQGKVACQTIAWGRGVCGTAAAEGRTVLVEDVENWAGHIACDAESRSEVVVPIRDGHGRMVGVVDVDCGVVGGFDEVDVRWLEELVGVLGEGCDW